MYLFEGGNTSVVNQVTGKEYHAERVDLKTIGLDKLRKDSLNLFNELNDTFYKIHKRRLWKPNEIKSGFVFNGSSSFVIPQGISDEEILKYKPKMGDIDITVPDYELKNLFLMLRKYENQRFGKFTYKGTRRQNENAIGDQIYTIFRYWYTPENCVNIQIDFESTEFHNGSPSEFAKFGHNSTFEDAEQNIKAYHHKILISAIMTEISVLSDVLVATKASTPDNIKQVSWNKVKPAKMIKFSVDNGLRNALEPMLDSNGNQVYFEGLRVFKEIPAKESKYLKNVKEIFNIAFRGQGNIKDFYSFIGLCKLMKKFCSKEQQLQISNIYFESIFGLNSNKKATEPDLEDDIAVRLSGVNYLENYLKIKIPRKLQRVELFRAKHSKES